MRAHSMSIYFKLATSAKPMDLLHLLATADGVVVGADAVEGKQHPMPINAEKETQVLVGRLRQVRGGSNAFMAFVSGDQLLKGAAYNAVQIYERLRHHIKENEL